MKYVAQILILLFFIPAFLQSQSVQKAPKREFRGAWVATVKNIDFPSAPGLPVDSLKKEWLQMLGGLKTKGINAVIVQVRPASDAFYPSDLAPWSAYLSGQQGLPPGDNFDPLDFMLKTAREAGMEFHAWLHPYRAPFDLDTLSLAYTHVFYQHRNWLKKYGQKFYLNPALPQVRSHLADVVAELLEKYDPDAVHFDDYFYPYKIAGEVWDDSLDFQNLGAGFTNIEDWRRENVNLLIRQISDTIKSVRPEVQFGVSPFGVWRNRDRHILGSDTRASQTCYDDLYADVLLWLKEGWIDYVAPQLYWNIGYEPADYEKLLYWWKDFLNGRNLYVGQAMYKVGDNAITAWHDSNEIPRQVLLNRSQPACHGSIFFSARRLLENPLGVSDSLQTNFYANATLLPMSALSATTSVPAPPAPKLRRLKAKEGGVLLRWKFNKKDRPAAPRSFAIYRFDDRYAGDFEDAKNLVATATIYTDELIFLDKKVEKGKTYTYALTCLNRHHIESLPSNAKAALIKNKGIKRKCLKKNKINLK